MSYHDEKLVFTNIDCVSTRKRKNNELDNSMNKKKRLTLDNIINNFLINDIVENKNNSDIRTKTNKSDSFDTDEVYTETEDNTENKFKTNKSNNSDTEIEFKTNSDSSETEYNSDTEDKTNSDSSESEEDESSSDESTSSTYYTDEDDDINNIYNRLSVEKWFTKLTKDDKKYYVDKIYNLIYNDDNIPSIKQIIDLGIDENITKTLIFERDLLNTYDKLSPMYTIAYKTFIKKYNYFTNKETIMNVNTLEKIEDEIIDHNSSGSIKDRILMSDFDKEIKTIIYNKYINSLSLSEDETNKYQMWINIVLSIPHKPKKIKIDETLPKNKAICNLIINFSEKLNQKIYGMDEAKEELLCTITNMINNPECKNKAIGLCGPSGIGKTLIASTLAETFGLSMQQISLGGVTDSSFLEGHGFTYSGSEPGCIVKALIKNGCTNGFIYFDEIDKISRTEKGLEIQHALLHITDFTQNNNFRDKYMPEIPINLSNVFFIYSMNSTNNIDPILLSRIPIIRLEGYTNKEKITILNKYLLPETAKNYNMKDDDIIITPNVAEYLISSIKEVDGNNEKSGVRCLKNVLNKIFNRINMYKILLENNEMSNKVLSEIPNFKLPYYLTTNFIDKILMNSQNKRMRTGYDTMYI